MACVDINDDFDVDIFPEDIDQDDQSEPGPETIEILDDSEEEAVAGAKHELIVIEDDDDVTVDRRKRRATTYWKNATEAPSSQRRTRPPQSVLKCDSTGCYKCHLCTFQSKAPAHLITHWDQEHELQTFRCLQCGAAFHSLDTLDHHRTKLHNIYAPKRLVIDILPPRTSSRRSSVKTARPVKVPSSSSKTKAPRKTSSSDSPNKCKCNTKQFTNNIKGADSLFDHIPAAPSITPPITHVDLLQELRIKRRIAHKASESRPKNAEALAKRPEASRTNPNNRIHVLDDVTLRPNKMAATKTFDKNPWAVQSLLRNQQPRTLRDDSRNDSFNVNRNDSCIDSHKDRQNDGHNVRQNDSHNDSQDDDDRLVIDEQFEAVNNIAIETRETAESNRTKFVPVYSPTGRSYYWVQLETSNLRRLRPPDAPTNETYTLQVGVSDNNHQSISVEIPADPH